MLWLLLFALLVAAAASELPLCMNQSVRLQACEKDDAHCGTWDIANRIYTPNNCRYRYLTGEDARQCVGSRTIACIGDSMIRDMCVGLASFLSGETVNDGQDYKYDKRAEAATHYANATKIGNFASWKLNKDPHNGLLFPKVDNGSTTDWKWQVQVWELNNREYQGQHRVEDVLMNKMAAEEPHLRSIDFALWGFGLHDQRAWRFEPFGESYFNTITSLWLRVRQAVATPVVWTAMNPHCVVSTPVSASQQALKVKQSKVVGFPLQAKAVTEANHYVRKALRARGLPYFDSAAPLRTPQICNLSSDGVHVKMWVDLVRAQILLNHLCDEDNNWIGDVGRF